LGCVSRMAGVYAPPRLSDTDMRRVINEFGIVDVMGGDFNARHVRWSGGLDSGRYPSGDEFATDCGSGWL